ncbi:hypothetical protein [Nonomuraea diastatica]|uniref:RiboL-PSP-HEPN domain-containing protein n=1 Tax=Nonomuraea diastatica TaxID=1848329 RepID=A0A4R4WT11_9ACTN|nr:hypothetical protein [Nonomuraea diastatica]TDD20740.1 hypothetical protein E1294_16975 [Nonomuraea diastatica]
MSGDARREFLSGVEALQKSLGTPLVSGGDAVGEFLRRGLAIVSYNLLEAFVSSRLVEIADHINSGIAHFSDLPENLQRASALDLLSVANSKARRARMDVQAAVAFAGSVGASLAANSGPIRLSPLMWEWEGSNMNAEDVQRALRLFHVEKPWETIREVTRRTGFHIPDPKTTLVGLLRERNLSAHSSSYPVSNLWIRAVPNQLQTLGMSFDILISIAANQINLANSAFFGDDKWITPSRLSFRFVRERVATWAEILEGKNRAAHVNQDRELAIRNAILASKGKFEVVIVQNSSMQVIDWVYPDLP